MVRVVSVSTLVDVYMYDQFLGTGKMEVLWFGYEHYEKGRGLHIRSSGS